MPALLSIPLVLLAAALSASACADDPAGPGSQTVQWEQVEWSGGTTNVAILNPTDGSPGPHPVIFALPWGEGTGDLVLSFIQRYWGEEAPSRGYYVVAPAVRGTSMAEGAAELIPEIFALMDAQLDYDASSVALVGASNGGRGIFHAALAHPGGFKTLVGLPGSYSGAAADLTTLAGKPVRLLVGELDTGWEANSQATLAALEAGRATASLNIIPGQGYALSLNVATLMDEIDSALGR